MIGATGRFAGLVVPELKKKGVVVRALVQDANKAAIAKTKGADETVLTVSETGYKLGFTNLSHFGRVFEKHFLMKPKRYKDSLN